MICSAEHVDRSRENNGSWKGGQTWSQKGYCYLRLPEHPRAMKNGYVKRADVVLEEKLGRSLEPGEIAHHKNEIKSDDSPDNLEPMLVAEHVRHHHPPKPRPPKKPRERLTEEQLDEISKRREANETLRSIAKDYPFSHVAIFKALRRRK